MSTINEKELLEEEIIAGVNDTPCADTTEEILAETAIPLTGECAEDAPQTEEAPLAVLVTELVEKKKDKKKKKKDDKKDKKKKDKKKAKKKKADKKAKKAKKDKKAKKNAKKKDKKKK